MEHLEVRYFEALQFTATGNQKAAQRLATLVERSFADMPVQNVQRSNKVVQEEGKLQCGLYAMHYMEHELREYLGEGHGAAGYPDPDKVQEELQSLLNTSRGGTRS